MHDGGFCAYRMRPTAIAHRICPERLVLNTVNIFIQIICESLYSRIEVHHLVHVCSVEGRAVIELS